MIILITLETPYKSFGFKTVQSLSVVKLEVKCWQIGLYKHLCHPIVIANQPNILKWELKSSPVNPCITQALVSFIRVFSLLLFMSKPKDFGFGNG